MDQSSYYLQLLFSGLTSGSVYALIAVSLVIVYRVSLVICFAQGEFFVVGALLMATLLSKGVPLPLAFAASIIAAGLLGALVERILIRPLRKATVGNLIVMTIAISLTLRGLAMLVWGKESHVVAPFSGGGVPLQILGATLQVQVLWIIAVTGAVLAGIWFFFEKTTAGLAMRACAENSLGSSLMGINHNRAASLAWAWGAAIGALAGAVIAPLLFVQYSSGVMPMVKGFIAMSIGGLASIVGAVVAGLVLGTIEAYTTGLLTSQFSDTIVFTLLILVLIFKPNGLFGKAGGREV